MLEIQLLGRFAARLDGRPLAGLDNAKVQELLCYLLINRNQAHHREKLSTMLWADCASVGEAKRYLRKAIWKLQRAFESTCFSQSLLVDHEWIEVRHHPDRYWIDIAGLESAFEAVRGLRGTDFSLQEATSTTAIVDQCAGELMEGRYYEWCIYERERYKLIVLLLLDRLTDYFESIAAYDTGCLYGLRILQHDPAREHTHQQLMRMRFKAGDRVSALRQYNHCVDVLDHELGVPPSPNTVALFEQIRAGLACDSATASSAAVGPKASGAPVLPTIVNDLAKLNAMLGEVQVQLDRNVKELARLR
jgi:DNA-binding SARP family transcriptional activator